MRRAARLEASASLVSSMFRNIERWTAWMPGVQSVRVLEQDGDATVALLRQQWMRRNLEQKWRFEETETGLRQVLLQGGVRGFRADWRFLPTPGDSGSTSVFVDIDVDLGLLGLITPSRVVERTLDTMFDEVVDKARVRIAEIVAGDTLSITGLVDVGVLLQVFESDRGLEVVYGGRRYLLQRLDEG